MLILSLFPGIDLLGRGFEQEAFAVVRGPDTLWGGDIRKFSVPAGRFDGVIAGPPCQDFSVARRNLPPTGEGVELLAEFARVVALAAPDWWLLENVPSVPDVRIDGYRVQRFDLRASECGGKQGRLRHFQFGSRRGLIIQPERRKRPNKSEPACLATEGAKQSRRTWADFCELQGLPRDFDLPGLSIAAKYRAVGNGVPVFMAATIARAIREVATADNARTFTDSRLCLCNCGRVVSGKQISATAACRKRLQKSRQSPRQIVTQLQSSQPGNSRLM